MKLLSTPLLTSFLTAFVMFIVLTKSERNCQHHVTYIEYKDLSKFKKAASVGKNVKIIVGNSLGFDYLNLGNVTESIFTWTQAMFIKSLNFSSANITELAETSFKNLGCMENLNLSHNSIRKLPGNIFQNLPSLKTLDCSYNWIKYVDVNHFLPIKKTLQFLDLTANRINKLHFYHTSKNSFNSLKSLNLSYNRLETLDSETLTKLFPKLTHLDLTGNRLANPPKIWPSLKNLQLGRNHMKKFDFSKVLSDNSTFPSLAKMNLSCNLLEEVNLAALEEGFRKLYLLDLRYNVFSCQKLQTIKKSLNEFRILDGGLDVFSCQLDSSDFCGPWPPAAPMETIDNWEGSLDVYFEKIRFLEVNSWLVLVTVVSYLSLHQLIIHGFYRRLYKYYKAYNQKNSFDTFYTPGVGECIACVAFSNCCVEKKEYSVRLDVRGDRLQLLRDRPEVLENRPEVLGDRQEMLGNLPPTEEAYLLQRQILEPSGVEFGNQDFNDSRVPLISNEESGNRPSTSRNVDVESASERFEHEREEEEEGARANIPRVFEIQAEVHAVQSPERSVRNKGLKTKKYYRENNKK